MAVSTQPRIGKAAGTPAAQPRVGVFGGAFDPPHNAHIALAQAALAQLHLAELRIFPTGQAWHKARALSAAEHRLAMVRLAFADLPGTVVDGRELTRTGPSYTLDTLRELRHERPDAQLVLILGADQGNALPGWHGWQEIVSTAIISIAVHRIGRAPCQTYLFAALTARRLKSSRVEQARIAAHSKPNSY